MQQVPLTLLRSLVRASPRLLASRGLAGYEAAGEVKEQDAVPEQPVLGHRFEKIGIPLQKSAVDVLMSPVPETEVTLARDGSLGLSDEYYRSLLNRAFGVGGWALVPVDEIKELAAVDPAQKYVHMVREYALYAHERFVSQAVGQVAFYTGKQSYSDATEKIKSAALIRCCKDVGVASELWDKRWAENWRAKYGIQEWTENVTSQRKAQLWRRKDEEWLWPFKRSTFYK